MSKRKYIYSRHGGEFGWNLDNIFTLHVSIIGPSALLKVTH